MDNFDTNIELKSKFFMSIQVKLFRARGFDIFSKNKVISRPLLTLCTMGPMCLFIIPMVTAGLVNFNDVDLVTDVLSSLFTGLLSSIKFTNFMYFRTDFVELIGRIRRLLAIGKGESAVYLQCRIMYFFSRVLHK